MGKGAGPQVPQHHRIAPGWGWSHLEPAALQHLPSQGEPDALGGLGSGHLTSMEVIFLEMSVTLMLAFPLLFPESYPSRRGKRFSSSGSQQLISVLLQTQPAGQDSREPTRSRQTLPSEKIRQKLHLAGEERHPPLISSSKKEEE